MLKHTHSLDGLFVCSLAFPGPALFFVYSLQRIRGCSIMIRTIVQLMHACACVNKCCAPNGSINVIELAILWLLDSINSIDLHCSSSTARFTCSRFCLILSISQAQAECALSYLCEDTHSLGGHGAKLVNCLHRVFISAASQWQQGPVVLALHWTVRLFALVLQFAHHFKYSLHNWPCASDKHWPQSKLIWPS